MLTRADLREIFGILIAAAILAVLAFLAPPPRTTPMHCISIAKAMPLGCF
jgi:hypothetical protein